MDNSKYKILKKDLISIKRDLNLLIKNNSNLKKEIQTGILIDNKIIYKDELEKTKSELIIIRNEIQSIISSI